MSEYYNVGLVSEDCKNKKKLEKEGEKFPEFGFHNSFVSCNIYNFLYHNKSRVYCVGEGYEKKDYPSYDEIDTFEKFKSKKNTFNPVKKILVNYDKKQYVDLEKYFNFCKRNKSKIVRFFEHITLLTGISWEGGIDYCGTNAELAGSWCGDLVEVVDLEDFEQLDKNCYEKISQVFYEMRFNS